MSSKLFNLYIEEIDQIKEINNVLNGKKIKKFRLAVNIVALAKSEKIMRKINNNN